MLSGRPFVGFLLITDTERAKSFYSGLLGLPIRHEDEFAIVLNADGTPLRLTVVSEVPELVGTCAGWLVDDLRLTTRALAAAGVAFERFDGMDQDADGIWRSHGGGGVAWFRDPDGNRLSLSSSST